MPVKNDAPPRILAAVAAFFLTAAPAAAQVLCGTVLDSGSGQPVAGVHVVAFNINRTRIGDAVSGADGRFSMKLPAAGDYRLLASRLGYVNGITEPLRVDSTRQASAVVRLVPRPVSLDTLTVVAKNRLPASENQLSYLVDAGFYRRRRWGFGYFLSRADIDKGSPLIMSDLLRDMPGVRIKCLSALRCTVTMRAARTMFFRGPCQPSIVLDGVLLSAGGTGGSGDVNELLNPVSIEAVEVYPGPEGVPVQWGGYLSPCGAIIAWSRR